MSSHVQFALFTLFPLLVLLSAVTVSLVYVRRIGEYKLALLTAILALMAQHQVLEAWGVFRTGTAVGGLSETIETGANVLSSVAVYYGLEFARRQQEIAAELEEAEQRYRTLTERSPLAIVVHRDGQIRFANAAAGNLFGVPAAETLVGESLSDRVHPEEREAFWEYHDELRDGDGTVRTREHRFVDETDDIKHAVVTGGCATYQGQEAMYLFLRDVTREREFEASYERAEAQLETTFESSNDAIFLIDPENDEILRANDRASELLGYDRAELVGMSPHRIHPHEVERFEAFVDSVRDRSRVLTDDLSCLTESGSEVPVEVSASLVTIDDRKCVLASARDVSDRRQREQQIDVLRRVLRHNLRNEMSVVLGYADTIVEEAENGTVRDAADRIADRASDLVSLSRSIRRLQEVVETRADGGAVEVREVVDRVVASYRDDYPRATIEVEGPDELRAAGVPGLEWALEELVENGIEHNDGEPRVHVSLDRTTTQAGQERVVVTVSDDGPGMPEDEQTALRVNAPRTAVSHGSGFGLHVVGQVVLGAGGDVAVTEARTGGAAVRVELPTPAAGN